MRMAFNMEGTQFKLEVQKLHQKLEKTESGFETPIFEVREAEPEETEALASGWDWFKANPRG